MLITHMLMEATTLSQDMPNSIAVQHVESRMSSLSTSTVISKRIMQNHLVVMSAVKHFGPQAR